MTNDWNSVEQSYPDKRGQYLCVGRYGDDEHWYDILLFSDKNDSLFNRGNQGFYGYNSEYGYYLNNDIIAWMDIPKYKGIKIE